MFVTLIRENDHLTALVRFEFNKVQIETAEQNMREQLWDIYRPEMSALEFAKANYRLNRLRTQGITWEVSLVDQQEEIMSS